MKKNLLVFVLIIGGIIIMVVYARYNANRLKRNHKFTTGTIFECHLLSKGGGDISIEYKYFVHNRVIKGSLTSNIRRATCNSYLKDKIFPVIYNPEDVELSTILITPSAFDAFGYSFPDSLKWVLEHIDE